MVKIIETERVILRELIPSDAINFYKLNADPEVIRYTGDLPFSSATEAESFLLNYRDYHQHGFGRWAVVTKDTNNFLGWCGLKLNEERFIDIGFRFFRSVWGKGYATESAKASLDYGFNQLSIDEIIGRVSSENKPSIRVLEKLNMKFWKYDNCEGIESAMYYRINKVQYNKK
jgi:RimJ/RimL family protein N-acetyltransferase